MHTSLAPAPLGLLRQPPEVQVAGDRVAAPDQDQPRFGEELDLHADLAAQRLDQRLRAPALEQMVRSSKDAPSL